MAVLVLGCATGGSGAPDGLGATVSVDSAAPMVTDRPDFTESAVTVAAGRVQAEAGYTLSGGDGATRHDLGELLVRIGVTGGQELRVGVGSYAWLEPESGATASGLVGPSLGLKSGVPTLGLADQAALLAGLTLPIETDLQDPGWAFTGILAAAWNLGAGGVGANLGLTSPLSDTRSTDDLASFASVSYGFPVGPSFGGFLELIGRFPEDAPAQADADAGLTWPLTPDLQLDVRVIRSLRGPENTAFGVGVAHRF